MHVCVYPNIFILWRWQKYWVATGQCQYFYCSHIGFLLFIAKEVLFLPGLCPVSWSNFFHSIWPPLPNRETKRRRRSWLMGPSLITFLIWLGRYGGYCSHHLSYMVWLCICSEWVHVDQLSSSHPFVHVSWTDCHNCFWHFHSWNLQFWYCIFLYKATVST